MRADDAVAHPVVSKRLWSRPSVLISLAAAILLIGYADLVRGGLTWSAALLTTGYLIFVPIAIMAVPASARAVRRSKKGP
jgi:hypothetical protein